VLSDGDMGETGFRASLWLLPTGSGEREALVGDGGFDDVAAAAGGGDLDDVFVGAGAGAGMGIVIESLATGGAGDLALDLLLFPFSFFRFFPSPSAGSGVITASPSEKPSAPPPETSGTGMVTTSLPFLAPLAALRCSSSSISASPFTSTPSSH